MESENNTSMSTIFLAVLGGAILGAGAALLYAPQSGRRTRQKLRDLREDAEDYAQEVLDKTADYVETAKSKGDEWLQKVRGASDEKRPKSSADGANLSGR
jgi:gas vesicle protein